MSEVDKTLDCSGAFCPEPVIRTAAQAKKMRPGQLLQVIGTDPGMQIDIPAWCFSHQHQLLEVKVCEGVTVCILRIGGSCG